jgi:hypothetical protein
VCLNRVAAARASEDRAARRSRDAAAQRANRHSACGRLLGPDNIWTAPALHDLGVILMDRAISTPPSQSFPERSTWRGNSVATTILTRWRSGVPSQS